MLVIRNGHVLSDGEEHRADVAVDNGTIVDVAPLIDTTSAEVIDATNCFVTPGFIDLQLNGAFGIDFTTQPDGLPRVVPGLRAFGVTSCLPTVISSPAHMRDAAINVLAGQASIGIHLEGPVLNPLRRGAHPAAALVEPNAIDISTWRRDNGVALVTLAPELPGALELVDELTSAGVVVSAGHTDATVEQFAESIGEGVRYVTHLFNAMRPFNHRDPGIIGAALTDPRVVCGLIADGLHVDPVAVRMAWAALGPKRCNLVSDAVAVLGVPEGRARVGNVELTVIDGAVRDPHGALAGSNLTLDQAVRNLQRWTGCSPAHAVGTVTTVPAQLLGLSTKGRVQAGYDADLVVLDRDLHVRNVVVADD